MLKQTLKRALIGSRTLRFASRFAGSGVAMIMYHSVQDDPQSQFDVLGGIIHSTEVFRGQMEVLARDFNPVTLEDVLHFVKGKELPRRSVVVTFDDGYVDNHDVARGVLDRLGIPAVFYVTVDCVDRQTLPWPGQLRHMFLNAGAPSWNDPTGNGWPLQAREKRLQAYAEAAKLCAKLSGDAQRGFLDSIQGELQAPAISPQQPMMSWEQVRSLDRNGYTIGSHTMTHPSMAQICPKDAELEFTESKRRLEQELRKTVVHFSYPCPSVWPHWADRTVDMSREAGYLTAVTTAGGMVRMHDNPLTLTRIRPTKTVAGLRWNLERTFCGAVV